jgi:transposase
MAQPKPNDTQDEEVWKVVRCAQQLRTLRTLGARSSWALATELFGWRDFRNRRQVGGHLGLVGMAEQSGGMYREHSISKAGNARLRALLVELSWLWLRYQSQSELSKWYARKFATGSRRLRRIGIVALARRLAVELWKYLQTGVIPEGALTKA